MTDVHAEEPIQWPGWSHPEGSVAIVTGAGSGIGQAASILAAQQGMRVAAWDIRPEGVQLTLDRAGAFAPLITPIIGDVGDSADVQRAMRETVDRIGTPIVLVNNAGPTILGASNLGFDEALVSAVGSIEKVSMAFLDVKPGANASVVNISAVSGSIAGGDSADDPNDAIRNGSWYPAAKAAILGYTRWCATEFGRVARFNAIAPGGPIETPRNRAALTSPGMVARIARNPLRRPGTAEELAAGILFLWSPAASYVNGSLLVIDGGLTLTGG